MYLASNIQIIFPEHRSRAAFMFKSVSSFKTESSWSQLTDTAEIILAKHLYFDDKEQVKTLIKTGDTIKIKGGYNGTFFDEFEGFVSEIQDDLPIILKCEDNMYVLKRTPVNISYASTKLEKLLKDVVPPQFKIDAMDVELGKLFLSKTTVAQVLQMLKNNYGLYSYFNGNTLVCGKIYTDNPETEVVKYAYRKNIIENDLKYRRKEDIKLKVTMTSYLHDGTNKTFTVGDLDGQEQKLTCTNITSEASIKALAQKELDRLKIDGYSGSLTGFGIPFVKHGYTVDISNDEYPNKSGKYYVDTVTTSFSNHGAYRRVLKIGPSAAK